MSQQSRTSKYKEKHPQDEKRRKERQRKLENRMRIHIKRNYLYKIPYPDDIDQESDVFKRVYDEYMDVCGTPVEIEEVVR